MLHQVGVFHLTYTMMHGSTKLKFSDAKEAKEIYNYKNIKRKLYRTNAAIWYNKIYRQKLTCNDNTCTSGRCTSFKHS